MTKPQNDWERYCALMDALSEEVSDMPDEMVLREYRQTATQSAESAQRIIRSLVGEPQQSPYEATKLALERQKRSQQPSARIPETAEGRRSLLARILGGNHPWAESATLAFRELGDPAELSDEEIQGLLEDLSSLNGDMDP